MDEYQPLPDDADHAPGSHTPSGACELIRSDVAWGGLESHLMLVRYCYFWLDRPFDEVLQHPLLRWNPFYWFLWVLAVGCIVSGRWTHSIFGQGDGFPGESELEREVRIYWLYCTDGPVLLATLFDFFVLGVDLKQKLIGWNNTTLELAISFCVNLGFLAGNVSFASAMRRRRATAVKMIIGCNFAFASGLAVALVYGACASYTAWDSTFEEASTYCLRVIVVLFILLACYIYAPLWTQYDNDGDQDKDEQASFDCGVVAPVAFVTILVWLLLFGAFAVGYSDVWAALT